MLLPSHSTSFIPCSGCLVINLGRELFRKYTLILWLEMHFPAHFVLQWGAWLSFLYKNDTAAALVKKRGKFATNQVVYLKSVVVILGYLPVLIS